MRTIVLLLLWAGCNDGDAPSFGDQGVADLSGAVDLSATLQQGAECENGIGGSEGTCAAGLKCCVVPCVGGLADLGCLDQPSRCEPDPPPPGYGFCR